MVRTFLKHAEEIQDNADMLEVPRTIFDYVLPRTAAQRGDGWSLCAVRVGSCRNSAASPITSRGVRQRHAHTNYQMAACSLSACVRSIRGRVWRVGEIGAESAEPYYSCRRNYGKDGCCDNTDAAPFVSSTGLPGRAFLNRP